MSFFRKHGSVVTLSDVNFYETLVKETLENPIYQRAYSWERANAAPIVEGIIGNAALKQDERRKNEGDLGIFILVKDKNSMRINGYSYNQNEAASVADGQSRLMTMQIFIYALNDYIMKNNLSVETLKPFNIRYSEVEVNNELSEFYQNRTRKSRFTAMYKYIYEEIGNHHWDVEGMVDTIKNCLLVTLKISDNYLTGFDLFEQVNTSGKPLDSKEFIHSTLKQFSNFYGIDLKYNVNSIVNWTRSYYSILEPYENKKFTNLVIRKFMEKHVTKNPESFNNFRTYLLKVADFEETTLFKAIDNLDRDRISNFAYALIAKGYNLNGTDKVINDLMLGLINFAVMATHQHRNPSGDTGEMLEKITKMIALGETPKDVYKYVKAWIAEAFKNYPVYWDNIYSDIDNLKDNIHTAIMLTDLWISNQSARYHDIWLEHAIAQKTTKVCIWTEDEEEQASIIRSIGNKFLLPKKPNRDCSNRYLIEKDVYYRDAFANNVGLDTSLNHFDAMRYHKERRAYAEMRKQKYIKFLYKLPFGNIMMIKND